MGDITYIPTWEGWVYLAAVIDRYSKKIIGYAVDDNYRTPLISTAIGRAARDEPLTTEAIFHTDRGSNYTSAEFHTTPTGLGLRHSLGRIGGAGTTPWRRIILRRPEERARAPDLVTHPSPRYAQHCRMV